MLRIAHFSCKSFRIINYFSPQHIFRVLPPHSTKTKHIALFLAAYPSHRSQRHKRHYHTVGLMALTTRRNRGIKKHNSATRDAKQKLLRLCSALQKPLGLNYVIIYELFNLVIRRLEGWTNRVNELIKNSVTTEGLRQLGRPYFVLPPHPGTNNTRVSAKTRRVSLSMNTDSAFVLPSSISLSTC